jgi:hypothetical protein
MRHSPAVTLTSSVYRHGPLAAISDAQQSEGVEPSQRRGAADDAAVRRLDQADHHQARDGGVDALCGIVELACNSERERAPGGPTSCNTISASALSSGGVPVGSSGMTKPHFRRVGRPLGFTSRRPSAIEIAASTLPKLSRSVEL